MECFNTTLYSCFRRKHNKPRIFITIFSGNDIRMHNYLISSSKCFVEREKYILQACKFNIQAKYDKDKKKEKVRKIKPKTKPEKGENSITAVSLH